MITPSVKALREIFGDDAKEAKRILKMNRAELSKLPAAAARLAECLHPPKTYDLRMHALNALGRFHGVEAFQDKRGNWFDYLNAGDCYAATLVRYPSGTYKVTCIGDIIERVGGR